MAGAAVSLVSDSRYALGIDVGGTKIAAGIVDVVSGKVAARRQIPTGYDRGGAAVFADTLALAAELKEQALNLGIHPASIGLGIAELVDPQGRIFSEHRIAWTGIDVAGRLGSVLPTVISADVRAAALAEARFGAGRDISHFYYVTIGTGVSGVLVLDGVPYGGSRGAALVIGNSMERHRCLQCGHVRVGMVEDIASGPGLVAAFGADGSAEDVLAEAAGGNTAAIDVIDYATAELGRVLALLVNSLDPQVLVVGGGLGSAPGPYFDALAKAVRAGLWDGIPNDLPIMRAALGPDAGFIGAACATYQLPESAYRPYQIN